MGPPEQSAFYSVSCTLLWAAQRPLSAVRRHAGDSLRAALKEIIDGKGSDSRSKQRIQGNQPSMNDYLLLSNVLKAPGHDQ